MGFEDILKIAQTGMKVADAVSKIGGKGNDNKPANKTAALNDIGMLLSQGKISDAESANTLKADISQKQGNPNQLVQDLSSILSGNKIQDDSVKQQLKQDLETLQNGTDAAPANKKDSNPLEKVSQVASAVGTIAKLFA